MMSAATAKLKQQLSKTMVNSLIEVLSEQRRGKDSLCVLLAVKGLYTGNEHYGNFEEWVAFR